MLCKNTITEIQKEKDTTLKKVEREEINATLRKNNEINRQYLQQGTNKKFTYLNFLSIRAASETTESERELLIPGNTDNSGEKPTCASNLGK